MYEYASLTLCVLCRVSLESMEPQEQEERKAREDPEESPVLQEPVEAQEREYASYLMFTISYCLL